jgi:DNA polymerase
MNLRPREARELIAFYRDAGVDALVGEEPVDRMSDVPLPSPTANVPFPEKRPPDRDATASRLPDAGSDRIGRSGPARAPAQESRALPSPDAAVMAAREAAGSAKTLDELRALLERFEGCALRSTATRLVFADGNPESRVMFVGEAPGYEEDMSGRAFVGRSGKLLDLMLAAIGLDRTRAYIANVVPWRPPGNRTPTPQETSICLPFMRRQIELANPDILICLGQPSTQTLLGTREGITRTRGRWFKFDTGTREIRAMPTFHPAYLLRQPLQKRIAWRDFQAIRKALAQ